MKTIIKSIFFIGLMYLSLNLNAQPDHAKFATADSVLYWLSQQWGKTARKNIDSIANTYYLLKSRDLLRHANSLLKTTQGFKNNLAQFSKRYVERQCWTSNPNYTTSPQQIPPSTVVVMRKTGGGVSVKMDVPLNTYLLSILDTKQREQLVKNLDSDSKAKMEAFWNNPTQEIKSLNEYFKDQKVWEHTKEEYLWKLLQNPELNQPEKSKIINDFNMMIETPKNKIDPQKIEKMSGGISGIKN
jgi:hypothetical protein